MEEKFFAEARKHADAAPADVPSLSEIAPPVAQAPARRFPYGLVALLVLLTMGAGVYVWLRADLQGPFDQVIASSERNRGVVARPHYQDVLARSVLVFDLISVGPSQTQTDVFRVLLQFAAKLKDREHMSVILAYRGLPRFKLEGGYFHQLGEDYSSPHCNPVTLMRNFPQNVKNMEGANIYPRIAGSPAEVSDKQMDNFADFHRRWYLDELRQPEENPAP